MHSFRHGVWVPPCLIWPCAALAALTVISNYRPRPAHIARRFCERSDRTSPRNRLSPRISNCRYFGLSRSRCRSVPHSVAGAAIPTGKISVEHKVRIRNGEVDNPRAGGPTSPILPASALLFRLNSLQPSCDFTLIARDFRSTKFVGVNVRIKIHSREKRPARRLA